MQLFLGDTNRTISETPMNQASSRSHCVFTIYMEARQASTTLGCLARLHTMMLQRAVLMQEYRVAYATTGVVCLLPRKPTHGALSRSQSCNQTGWAGRWLLGKALEHLLRLA